MQKHIKTYGEKRTSLTSDIFQAEHRKSTVDAHSDGGCDWSAPFLSQRKRQASGQEDCKLTGATRREWKKPSGFSFGFIPVQNTVGPVVCCVRSGAVRSAHGNPVSCEMSSVRIP